jgi:hypothetical protein
MVEQDYYVNEFNDWASLADADPDAFERMRRELIDDFIDSAPPDRRERLRCLQWRIEQERIRSHTPLGACIRITRMMWERVTCQGGLIDQLQNLRGSVEYPGQKDIRQAEVLNFPTRTE